MGRYQFADNICRKCNDARIHFSGPVCTECGTPARRQLWHVFALLAMVVGLVVLLPMCAAVVYGSDPLVVPARLVIPDEFKPSANVDVKSIPRLELIVPSPVAAAPSACPLDASVIVTATDKPNQRFIGSGTCVASKSGVSTILTCAHTFRGLKEPTVTITHQKKVITAKLLRLDEPNDLAVLEVNADLPAVDLSATKPGVSATVTSVGISRTDDAKLEELSHRITAVDKYDNPRNFESDGQQIVGRSGGGLFFNGQLCGIIQGRRNDIVRSIYVSIEPIREILKTSQIAGAGAATEPVDVEFIKDRGYCAPCNRTEWELSGGAQWPYGWTKLIADGRLRVKKLSGVGDWYDEDFQSRNPLAGYPFYRFKANGEWKTYYGATNAEKLLEIVTSESHGSEVSAASSGVTLSGKETVSQILGWLTSIAGDGSEISLKIHREGAADALLLGKTYIRTDIVGTSGRVEIVVTSAKKIPVHQLKFDYRFDKGKLFLKLDEIECEIPEEGVVGAAQPVGSPILIAWTVFSTIDTIYRIFHPTASVWIGKDIEASAKLSGGQLTVDLSKSQIAARLEWAFWMGLLRFEYSRPFTGLVLGENLVLQFHKSRIYRDVNVDIK